MAMIRMYESLHENFKERSGRQCHMLGTQISSIQGFSASYFHIWHQKLGRQLEKLSLVSLWEGHEDPYDVSNQSAFFDYLSYLIGQIQRTSHRIICSQAYYGLSTMAPPHIPLLASQYSNLTIPTPSRTRIQHLVHIDNHVEDIMGFISLGSPWQSNHIKNHICWYQGDVSCKSVEPFPSL
jgi:hypothetical protein